MTERRGNTGWRRWRRVLGIAVATAAFIALLGWQHRKVGAGVPQAVAQPVGGVDAAAAAALPDVGGTGEALTPGAIQADANTKAHGWPTPSEIEQRLRLQRWLATVRRPGAAPAQPVGDDANRPAPELVQQHQRVLATLTNDAPPPAIFLNPNGPPRMDSGHPNPDRVRKADSKGQYLPDAAAR